MNYNAYIGLRPSPENLFVQMFNRGFIEQAIISIAEEYTQKKEFRYALTISGLNHQACKNWTFHRSLSENAWILHLDRVAIGGRSADNQRVSS